MNVDFMTLSSAVQQANNVAVEVDPPRKVPARRRSSRNNLNASALQFLEAAHKSWSDLPDETTALQRRKSMRSDKALADIGHKSFNFGENGHKSFNFGENGKNYSPSSVGLKKEGTSKAFPISRRASMGALNLLSADEPRKPSSSKRRGKLARRSSIQVTNLEPNRATKENNATNSSMQRRGKLTRRSSIQVGTSVVPSSATKENSATAGVSQRMPARRVGSDSSTKPEPTKRSGPKFARRSTISHCTSMDDSSDSLTSPKLSKRDSRSSKGSSQKPAAKGNVRFELDHKNRIKRRVSYIRAQSTKTDASKLWWSEEELDRIYERENKVYEKYSENRSYKRKLQRLWSSSSKASGSGGAKPLSPESLGNVAGSACRGLEVDILETVRDRRARVIGSLLDAQESLNEFDSSIRTKVLSARYKNLCKAATRFARKMGEGDALEAANVYSN